MPTAVKPLALICDGDRSCLSGAVAAHTDPEMLGGTSTDGVEMSTTELHDGWRTPLEPHDARSALVRAAASRRARVIDTADELRFDGGRRLAYRLIGSRSNGAARWMPWSSEVHVATADPSGSTVRVYLTSNQGYYAYQGEPARLKWEALLGEVALELRAATEISADPGQ